MMVWAIVFSRGGTVVEVQKWLKSADVRVRVVDADKDGVPEVATWFDRSGVVLQRWIDDDEDGQADRVGIYENGKVARVIE